MLGAILDNARQSGPVAIGPTDLFAGPRAISTFPSLTRLDRSIKERSETDVKLVNWWLYALVLSWLTLGVYPLYIFGKRISRADRFGARKRDYHEALVEWTRRYAKNLGRIDAVHEQLLALGAELERAQQEQLRPIRAGRSLLLTVVTLGIYGLFVTYRLNRFWWDAELTEQAFNQRLSRIWLTLGLVRCPIGYDPHADKRRSFGRYLLLSLLTLGIWAAVWDYKLHTDPDSLYGDLHRSEDSLLGTVRTS